MARRLVLLSLVLGDFTLHAQTPPMQAANEGIWQGYDGEWRYVPRLLISMAEAIPADKYGWRPAPGVRSVSEVLMHIVGGCGASEVGRKRAAQEFERAGKLLSRDG